MSDDNTDIKQRIAETLAYPYTPSLKVLLRDCLKHIEELEKELRSQLREWEADCAAMREVLRELQEPFWMDGDRKIWDWRKQIALLENALHSTGAGRELLERLQAVEKERDRYKAALEQVYGFGRSAHGTPDMTFDELAGYVNETCEEALQKDAQ